MRKVLLSSLIFCGIVIVAAVAWFMMADADGPSTATRQVVDATGETVTVPVHPRRVVFLNVSNLDLYDAAGGRDAIVASRRLIRWRGTGRGWQMSRRWASFIGPI